MDVIDVDVHAAPVVLAVETGVDDNVRLVEVSGMAAGGRGDMSEVIYDPQQIQKDAFDLDSFTKTTTGNRIGLYTANLADRPRPYITPRDLGVLPNGQDVRNAILDCFDIAMNEGFKRVCLDGDNWYSSGYLQPPKGLELFGRSRSFDKIEIKIIGGRTSPAIWVLADDIHIHDLEIMANDNDAIAGWPVSGFGEAGCCITVSTYVSQGVTPPAVSGFKAERLLLTRKAGTRAAGGIMPLSGTRHAIVRDIIVDGTKGARHTIAVQSHWGAKPGVSEWDLSAPSMHPHEIVYENITIRGCDTGFTISAGYNILAKNFDMDGVSNMLSILAGDEGNYLTPADEKSAVLKGIHCVNFVGRNLKYQGAGNYMISMFSRGTSKGRYDADNPGQFAYTTMDCDILLENFVADGGNGVVPDGVYCRYNTGTVTMKNFFMTGFTNEAYDIENNAGNIRMENCHASGGRIEALANNYLVIDGCRVVGTYDMARTTSQWGLFVEGRTGRTATLAADVAQGAQKLVLTAPFTYPVLKGDRIEIAPSNVCYATEAFSTSMTTIRVTPVPAAAASGTVITLDKRTHEVKVLNGTMFDNIYRGIEATDVRWLEVDDAIISRHGQYGMVLPNNAKGSVRKTRFVNGGARYHAEPPAVARDILIQTGSHLDCSENHYAIDALGINYGLVVQADALGGFDRNSLYYTPTTGPFTNACALFDVINPRNGVTLQRIDIGMTGNDANGYWAMRDDGVLECWLRNQPTAADGTFTWTFPKPFNLAATVSVVVGSATAIAQRIPAAGAPTATSVLITNKDLAGVAASGNFFAYAIGRWR
jgi:hypothetical protein